MYIFTDTVHFYDPVYTLTPTSAHTYPLLMEASGHFLAPALHDDFSRCLSLGHRQPWDWEGVPGAGLLSFPGRSKTRGGGAIFLEILPDVVMGSCSNSIGVIPKSNQSRKVYKG